MLLLCRKALLDADLSRDNLNYHLPFAAIRGGVFAEGEYAPMAWLQICFDLFLYLHDFLKGWLWRLTGSVT